jgi:serine/threonine protein kinase
LSLSSATIPMGAAIAFMENRTFLGKYRAVYDRAGMPVELRRSAAGVTCHAQEIETGRDVALELVPTRGLDAETREKIASDAAAAKQVNHVNIPVLYDFGFDGDDLVYVTEYLEGTTADSWLATHGPMPVRAVLHIALQFVSALGAAALNLVFHRAIHPGNILIVSGQTAEGEWPLIKVLNFGRMASNLGVSAKKMGLSAQLAPFASPEQVKEGTVDFRAEIYSLGCTLWSLLTGVSPFNAPGETLAEAPMAEAMKRFSGVPKKIRRLITEMAATNPDERPLDPVMMTERLQDCLASVARREAIARRIGIPATWQRRRVARLVRPVTARPFAMATVVLVLAALIAAYVTKGSKLHSLWTRSAQAPIGVPVGVPERSIASNENISVKPVSGDTATATREADLVNHLNAATKPDGASALPSPAQESPASPSPPSTVAATNQETAGPSPASTPDLSEQQTAVAPVPPTIAAAAQNSAPVIPVEPRPSLPNEEKTNAAGSSPPETAPSPAAAAAGTTTETATTEPTEHAAVASSNTNSPNKVPRAELIEGPPLKSSASHNRLAHESNRSAVPRAELVEPPPPREEPEDATGKGPPPSTEKMENVPRAELVEPPPPKTTRQRHAQPSNVLTKSELAVIRKVSRRAARQRIRVDGDGAMVQTPDGMVHARFVGTTPDGQWMLALPSRKIMIVPPPPDFIPR